MEKLINFNSLILLLLSITSIHATNTTSSSEGITPTYETIPVDRLAELTSSQKFVPKSNGADSSGTQEDENDPEKEILQFLNSMKTFVRDITDKALRHLLPVVMKMSSELRLSNNCTMSFLQIVKGLREFKPWTMKLLDANSKIPEGILHGSMSTFGSYDECLNVVVNDEDPNSVRGQYCSINISPFLPPKPRQYTFDSAFRHYPTLQKKLKDMHMSDLLPSYYFIQHRFGLCLPSSCSRKDVNEIASMASHHAKINVTVVHCETKQSSPLTNGQIIASAGITGMTAFIMLATFADITPRIYRTIFRSNVYKNKEERKGTWQKFIRSCSAYSNSQKLLSTKVSTNSLRAIHGIRFLSCTWIILGHTYYCKNYIEIAALSKVKQLGYGVLFQVVLNAGFAADTFFFLSGLLVVYVTLKKLEEWDGKFNTLFFYVRRYSRLTPAFVLASGLVILGPLYGSGPIWYETLQPFVKGCESNWWTNLLYISNFVRTSEACVPHGWYISCDMQFYLISPLIIVTLYKRPSLGKLLIAAGIVLSMAIVGSLTLFYEQPPVSLFSIPDPSDVNDFLDTIGYKPYTHFSSYCVGMATGYVLVKHNKLTIRPVYQLVGWLAATAISLTIVYGTLPWNSGDMPSLPITLFYAATCRPMWSLCVAWVTLTCVTGHGGIINTILSWKTFIPLSRLCYLAYLLHPLMMYVYVSFRRSVIHFSQYTIVYMFLGHLCITFGLAFVYSLVFESPFIRLEKLLARRFASRWRYKDENHTEMKDTVVVKSINKF